MPSPLPVTELIAELTPQHRWRLPEEPARMVRSAFGLALFDGICIREHRDCRACDLRERCEIPCWWNPGKGGGHRASPMLPEPITPGGAEVGPDHPLRVRAWLLGEVPRPGLVIEALVRMGRRGLGAHRVPHGLRRLSVRGPHGLVRVVEDEVTLGIWPPPAPLEALVTVPEAPRGATVLLQTPLCLGDARSPPTAGALVSAAIGRLRQLHREERLPQPPRWPDPGALTQPLQLARLHPGHHQSSGGGVQDLSGWTGLFRFGPEVAAWAAPLAACTVLGLGQATSTGRGRIAIDWA